AAFPYARLLEESRRRNRHEPEYELLDTGVFDGSRYFDVHVEYVQVEPEDLVLRVRVHNRGPETAPIHVIPQVWLRNTWSWQADGPRPGLELETPERAGIDAGQLA